MARSGVICQPQFPAHYPRRRGSGGFFFRLPSTPCGAVRFLFSFRINFAYVLFLTPLVWRSAVTEFSPRRVRGADVKVTRQTCEACRLGCGLAAITLCDHSRFLFHGSVALCSECLACANSGWFCVVSWYLAAAVLLLLRKLFLADELLTCLEEPSYVVLSFSL